MAKKLPPAGILALKEALCSVYWYKAELRGFLQHVGCGELANRIGRD